MLAIAFLGLVIHALGGTVGAAHAGDGRMLMGYYVGYLGA
jgi:hypothetical protein